MINYVVISHSNSNLVEQSLLNSGSLLPNFTILEIYTDQKKAIETYLKIY